MQTKPLCIALGGLTLAMAPLLASAQQLITARQPIANRYIVVLKDDAASLRSEAAAAKNGLLRGKPLAPSLRSLASTFAGQYPLTIKQTYDEVLRGFAIHATPATVQRLLRDPRVAYIEQDGVMRASATQTGATWGIDRVDQRNLPLDGRYTYTTNASNVSAYVIDTGILASHSQFGGRVQQG